MASVTKTSLEKTIKELEQIIKEDKVELDKAYKLTRELQIEMSEVKNYARIITNQLNIVRAVTDAKVFCRVNLIEPNSDMRDNLTRHLYGDRVNG